MKGGSEADSYEENGSTYLGVQIAKMKNGDFEGVILDPNTGVK